MIERASNEQAFHLSVVYNPHCFVQFNGQRGI